MTQKTYVLLLQPSYDKELEKAHNVHFQAREDEDLMGAFIDFTLEMERKLLKAQGKNFEFYSHFMEALSLLRLFSTFESIPISPFN